MSNVFEDIVDWISDLFSGIWDFIKTYLPYILLACALFVLCVAPISLAFLGVTGAIEGAWGAAFLAGASFLLFPDETASILVRSVDQVGAVAEEVASEVVDTADTVVSGVLSSSSLWLLLGAAGLFFLLRSSDDERRERPKAPGPLDGKSSPTAADPISAKPAVGAPSHELDEKKKQPKAPGPLDGKSSPTAADLTSVKPTVGAYSHGS